MFPLAVRWTGANWFFAGGSQKADAKAGCDHPSRTAVITTVATTREESARLQEEIHDHTNTNTRFSRRGDNHGHWDLEAIDETELKSYDSRPEPGAIHSE